MNILDLFSGTGGFSYGFQKHGITPVAFCENEIYAQKVLKKHWPNTPIFNDVTTLTKSDLSTLDFDIITGGFPCQDISISGKNSGINGERSGLWKEFMRIIDETQPKYAVFENVFALCSRGLDQLLQEFAKIGYDACWTTLDTQYFGLPQRRRRVYILAVRDGIPIGADPFDFTGRDSAKLKQEIIHFKESREWNFTQSKGVKYPFAYFTRQRSNEFSTQGVASTIAKRDYKDFTDLVLDDGGLRKLSVGDRLSLQGYPRDYFDGVNLTNIQSYQLNGMSINVIEWLAKRILEYDRKYG